MVKNRLLEIRLKLGYKKQKDFAAMLGVNYIKYNKWENNLCQPGVETLLKIAEKIDCKVDDIVYLYDKD